MSKAKEISDGFGSLLKEKLGLVDKDAEALFQKRNEICNACEFKSKAITPVCSICHCILALKTRSINSECPKKLW